MKQHPLLAPEKTNYADLTKHETKRHVMLKFLLIVAVFFAYFAFIAYRYGLQQGFFVTALSWSFFVLCTPIADAGFLLDFPIRLITRLRMFLSEIIVWILAIFVNLYAFFLHPEMYEKTRLLEFFHQILAQPIPFWSIVLISGFGTFFSVKFGDELMDKSRHHERVLHQKHKHHHRILIFIFLFVIVLIFYRSLLKNLGIELPM
ncbi:hypothetical protein HN954_03690 [bacterium]|jgi:hypothetical protein|nr:hypothetical protein [bacterium]MBT6831479.1 hypothetical protein [bacterium]MBT6996504.1 hypothetical protein [bacterium]MBT7772712.1 hypothetical protein [bacterium]